MHSPSDVYCGTEHEAVNPLLDTVYRGGGFRQAWHGPQVRSYADRLIARFGPAIGGEKIVNIGALEEHVPWIKPPVIGVSIHRVSSVPAPEKQVWPCKGSDDVPLPGVGVGGHLVNHIKQLFPFTP